MSLTELVAAAEFIAVRTNMLSAFTSIKRQSTTQLGTLAKEIE